MSNNDDLDNVYNEEYAREQARIKARRDARRQSSGEPTFDTGAWDLPSYTSKETHDVWFGSDEPKKKKKASSFW